MKRKEIKDIIIPQLNGVLEFMFDQMNDLKQVTPQHIIQHFMKLDYNMDLIHAKSLLQTLEKHGCVIESDGSYSLTPDGEIMAKIGGWEDIHEFDYNW